MQKVVPGGEPMLDWLWRSTWQGAVLILLVLAVQWLFRKRLTPSWRYSLWLLVLVRLALPVSWESSWSVFNLFNQPPTEVKVVAARPEPVKAPTTAPMARSESELPAIPELEPTTPSPADRSLSTPVRIMDQGPSSIPVAPAHSIWTLPSLSQTLTAIWVLGGAFLALRTVWQNVRFARLLRGEPQLDSPDLLRLLDQCRERMGLRQGPILVGTCMVQSPALYGFVRPCLLLPTSMASGFSHQELRYVFMHELAHIKRWDMAINWLMTLLQIIHWFNPLVWYGFSRMRADRELACDALALSRMAAEENRPYGETILKLLERLAGPAAVPGLVGISEDKHQLKERIRMIAGFRRAGRWSVLAIVLVAGLAVVGLSDARKSIREPADTNEEGFGSSAQQAPRTVTLHGRVTDPQGNTLAGVLIDDRSMVSGGNDLTDNRCFSDKQGGFTVNVPVSNRWYLHVSAQGFRPLFLEVRSAAKPLEVRLYPILTVYGQVVDEGTGLPIVASRIVLGGRMKDTPGSPKTTWRAMAATTVEGRYSFMLKDEVSSFQGLPPTGQFGVEALGYVPAASPAFELTNSSLKLDFKLIPGKNLRGRVLDAGGKTCPDAPLLLESWGNLPPNVRGPLLSDTALLLQSWRNQGQIRNGKLVEGTVAWRSDSQGYYESPVGLTDPAQVYVIDERGYAHVNTRELTLQPDITLKGWGTLEGTIQPGGRPWRPEKIELYGFRSAPLPGGPMLDYSVTTDAKGKFRFEQVPPDELGIAWVCPSPRNSSSPALAFVRVKSGETTRVDLSSRGRPAVFRLKVPPQLEGKLALEFPHAGLAPELPYPRPPKQLKTASEILNWYTGDNIPGNDVGWTVMSCPSLMVAARSDGSFAIASVPEGRSQLWIELPERNGEGGAYVLATLDVVPAKPGQENSPVDLGTFSVHPPTFLKVGDVAPQFTFRSPKGAEASLKDFRGRYVVLDFGFYKTSAASERWDEYTSLKAEIAKNKRLACLSFYRLLHPEDVQTLATCLGVEWPCFDLGPYVWTEDALGYGGQRLFLIDPDGRVAAIENTVEDLKPALAQIVASTRG